MTSFCSYSMVAILFVVTTAITTVTCQSDQETVDEIERRLMKLTESLVSYQRCWIDQDCLDNSICFSNDNTRVGLCKCQAGFEMVQRNRTFYACLTLSKWQESCQITEQCIDDLGSYALCDNDNDICTCQPNTARYDLDMKCHKMTLLDDYCRSDANCVLQDGSYAFCADGRCQCNIGLRPSTDRTHCVITRQLGDICQSDEECHVNHTTCSGVCRCQIGYVISGDSCLNAATQFGAACEEDLQCSEFLIDSLCQNNTCGCQIGWHGYEDRCMRDRNIGASCTNTNQCVMTTDDRVECLEGVCACVTVEGALCNRSCLTTSNIVLIFISIIFYAF